MTQLRNTALGRFIAVFLMSVLFVLQAYPVATVFAEGEDVPPPVEVSAPTPEPAPAPEPEPTPSEAPVEPAPEPTPEEVGENATAGENGTDGEPQPDTAGTDGENGTDQTPTDPATDGENGNDGATDETPEQGDGAPAVIDTGNASAESVTTNGANIVDTNTGSSGGSTDEAESTTVTTETEKLWAPPPGWGPPPGWVPPPGWIAPPWWPKTEVTTVENTNELEMTNEGEAEAATGENVASDADGAEINTGDADSFGYLISLFNVAITNSTGSILFLRNPLSDALDFTQRIMDIFSNIGAVDGECNFLGCELSDAVFNLLTDNGAEVTNELIVRSGTGGNDATATQGTASVNTGDAQAFGGIVNFGNLQIIDSRYLVILMTNVGDLAGDIILPDPSFFEKLSAGAKIARGSSLAVDNNVDITNDGTTNADTGTNDAAAEEAATVTTGDANADTSIINFANQIGSPICFIVSVGGEWNGDVKRLPAGFSREKTAFGEIICGSGSGDPRSLRDNFHATTTNYAKILNKAIVEATTGDNSASGLAAEIKTGNADAFLQILNVVNQTIIGQDWIFALFTVSGDWNGNLVFGSVEDGSDPIHLIASQMIAGSGGGGGGNSGGYTSNPKIEIVKTASVNTATIPASVDYTIVVKNVGEGAAYRSKLTDTLRNEKGDIIFKRSWLLDSIQMGEEIKVTYTVKYNDAIPTGKYTNTAKVTAYRNSSIYVHPQFMDPAEATATVDITNDMPVEEAAYEAPTQCVPLLKSYLKIDGKNDVTDVRNLQNFLKKVENEQLDENGIYDSITIAAVKRFQTKYAAEVLDPWGINEPTGHVYYTTQRKVNDLACINGDTFPLTPSQIEEINSYKNKAKTKPQLVNPVLDGIGKKAPAKAEDLLTAAPKPEPIKVLLKDVTPEGISKAVSESQPALSGFTWLTYLIPFVDALEVK